MDKVKIRKTLSIKMSPHDFFTLCDNAKSYIDAQIEREQGLDYPSNYNISKWQEQSREYGNMRDNYC